jgi:hypothetical protein
MSSPANPSQGPHEPPQPHAPARLATAGAPLSTKWIISAYGVLLAALMIFYVVLSVMWSKSEFTPEFIPKATETVLDLVKVVVGAVVGALTPGAVSHLRSGGNG